MFKYANSFKLNNEHRYCGYLYDHFMSAKFHIDNELEIIWAFKPFFYQVDIRLYLTNATALRHSNELYLAHTWWWWAAMNGVRPFTTTSRCGRTLSRPSHQQIARNVFAPFWLVNLRWLMWNPSDPVIGEIFGHNRLRPYCLQVQSITCWHPPVILG